MNPFTKLWKNVKGEVQRIIGICVSLLVAGILLPLAIIAIANTTVYAGTGVPQAVITVVTVLLPVLAVIGIAMMYLKYTKTKG